MKLPDMELLATKAHQELVWSKRIAGLASFKSAAGDELLVPYEQLPERAKELFRDEARSWRRIFEETPQRARKKV